MLGRGVNLYLANVLILYQKTSVTWNRLTTQMKVFLTVINFFNLTQIFKTNAQKALESKICFEELAENSYHVVSNQWYNLFSCSKSKFSLAVLKSLNVATFSITSKHGDISDNINESRMIQSRQRASMNMFNKYLCDK